MLVQELLHYKSNILPGKITIALLLIIPPFELGILAYSASMYLENVFLHGWPAPVLPDIFASECSEGVWVSCS